MTPERITSELSNCKTVDRYLTDVRGNRFWVFGTPTGELLVRRIVDGVMKPLRTMQYDEVVAIEPTTNVVKQPEATITYSDCVINVPKRATSVKTLVKLANELHDAYAALNVFDDESRSLEMVRPVSHPVHQRKYQRDCLVRAVDKATDRLAAAIDKTTPARLRVAERAMGDKVYVFDGF